jgi:hypothetical protein
MSKTKLERVEIIDEEIAQLLNRRKELMQQHREQERKERTKRLCRRMGLFESLVPESIPLTEEQFRTFLEKTVASPFGRGLLADLTAQNAVTPAASGKDDTVTGDDEDAGVGDDAQG